MRPLQVAGYIETMTAQAVKQALAATPMLFDWLVIGQIVPTDTAEEFAALNTLSASCFSLDAQEICRAFSRTFAKTGNRIAASTEILAITTSK